MTVIAVLLIVCSTILHAFWNFLCKKGHPSFDFFLVFSFSIMLTLSPFVLFGGVPLLQLPGKLFFWAMCSGFAGTFYNIGLAQAYRKADISLVYPVSRALQVILTALVTMTFHLGSTLSPWAVTGIAVTFCGCFLIPITKLHDLHWSNYFNAGTAGILLATIANTSYTVTDSMGIHAMLEIPEAGRIAGAATYSFFRECFSFTGICLATLLIPRARKDFSVESLRHYHPYLAGASAALTYLLVLIAMGFMTNVSYVQAFRQLGLPIGVALGVIFLHEKINRWKIAALTLILAGLALLLLTR